MDELYVIARRVLLDALDGLGHHRQAVVLVGAQAVYLHVKESDLAVAAFTTDGDLAIDPAVLTEIPPLEVALRGAGFSPETDTSVGVWITHRTTQQQIPATVAVDLLVPQSVSPGKGRRAARLSGHDARSARLVKGLEGTLVDADEMEVRALDSEDLRSHRVRVAGPAALLVAKVHKISERVGTDRLKDKDALDVYRLLRGVPTEEISARYRRILGDERSSAVGAAAIELFETQFSTRSAVGVEMVVRSLGALGDEGEIAESCRLLATDLLADLRKM